MSSSNEHPLMPLVDYGKSRLGFNRMQSYRAADRGDFPCVTIGRLRYVPVRKADQMLGLIDETDEPAPSTANQATA